MRSLTVLLLTSLIVFVGCGRNEPPPSSILSKKDNGKKGSDSIIKKNWGKIQDELKKDRANYFAYLKPQEFNGKVNSKAIHDVTWKLGKDSRVFTKFDNRIIVSEHSKMINKGNKALSKFKEKALFSAKERNHFDKIIKILKDGHDVYLFNQSNTYYLIAKKGDTIFGFYTTSYEYDN